MTDMVLPSSFRDPSGFIFIQDGSLYRQVNIIYKENYDLLIDSGLYEKLVNSELLIPHDEVSLDYAKIESCVYKILKPEIIPFISYPYEWCFSQLKDAALLTLKVQKIALEHGMSLKDCSVYNIQFRNGKPVFIDTLSFEKYQEGPPWIAYRQFCQHFLVPLALMSYRDIRFNQLLRLYIDGIPLDLASPLLPFKSYLEFSLLSHIHLHAKSQKHFVGVTVNTTGNSNKRKMNRISFLGLIDSLESSIKKLQWQPEGTEWADYYNDTNYTSQAFEQKKQLVAEFLSKINPTRVWDLGANDGTFSRIAGDKGIQTVSFDIDPAAVEKNYRECISKNETNMLPILFDLTNPSPGIGWHNQERMSLLERGPTDTVIALALIHHLAISNNVPLVRVAEFLSSICKSLIIEFVPKNDSQVQRLLATREDVFPYYTQENFGTNFGRYFTIQESAKIKGSERVLFLMQRR